DRFPDEMPVKIRLEMKDGNAYSTEKRDYEGFHTRPMRWDTIIEKFDRLARPYTSSGLRGKIVDTVQNFENKKVAELMQMLTEVRHESQDSNKGEMNAEEYYG
ncbi:MAG: hypothetical protein R3222_06240, partial [Balneolaceae bacterium]|nr:hypothetical protein [Balneolaceae bacterium]